MSEPRETDASEPGGANPETGAQQWDPDGVDLAKAMLARAKANGRAGRTKKGPRERKRPGPGFRSATGSGWSGPGRDDRDPQPLASAVEKLTSEHGWDDDLSVHGVIARWAELVGSDVAAHVTPEHYDDTVLTVRADSTAWATQVRLLASELVRRINVAVGHGSVTRVDVLGPQSRSWTKGPRSVPGRGPRDTYG